MGFIPVDVDLDHLVKAVFAGFLHSKGAHPPNPHPSHTAPFGRKSELSTLWRSGSYAPPPGGLSIYLILGEFFCMGDVSLHSRVYLLNHVFTSVQTPGYLVYTLGYNPVPLYFVAQMLQLWPLVSEVAQSCLTLCDPMDCSLLGSSIHGIFQAGILEWVAISFSRGSSQPRDRTRVSRIVGRCFSRLSLQGSLFFKKGSIYFFGHTGS